MNYEFAENLLKICFSSKLLVELGSFNILGFGNPESKNVAFLDNIYTEDEIEIPEEITFDLANEICINILEKNGVLQKLKDGFGDDFLDKWYITFANRDIKNKDSMQTILINRVWNRILMEGAEKVVFVGKSAWNCYTEDIDIRKTLENGRKIDDKFYFVIADSIAYHIGKI